MALIVEDGSNVAGANSFASLAAIREYNDARGVPIPPDDDALTALALKAMDYMQAREDQLQGRRTFGPLQELSWPRTGVVVMGYTLASTYVPKGIVAAQCYLAGVANTVDLVGNLDTPRVVLEQIGPIKTQYSPTAGATYGAVLPQFELMLKPFGRNGLGSLRAVRV